MIYNLYFTTLVYLNSSLNPLAGLLLEDETHPTHRHGHTTETIFMLQLRSNSNVFVVVVVVAKLVHSMG